MTSSEGFIRAKDGVRLHYRSVGDGRETVVVLLESSLSPDLDALSTGRRVVYYDPRGRGQSDSVGADSTVGMGHDISDLEAVRDELELGRVALVGWSYYGGVVSRYAARYSERVSRVVQVAPLPARRVPYFDQGIATVMARLDQGHMSDVKTLAREVAGGVGSPSAICEAWMKAIAPAYLASAESLGRMRARPCAYANENPLALTPMLGRLWQDLGDWDWRSEIAEMKAPRLVVLPENDFQAAAGTEEWAVGHSVSVVRIPAAGHMVWLDSPDALFDSINTFLDDQQRRRP